MPLLVCSLCLCVSTNQILDATQCGSIGRFINHSCNPNCCVQKWYDTAFIAIGLSNSCLLETWCLFVGSAHTSSVPRVFRFVRSVGKRLRVAIFSSRTIKNGQELSINYSFDRVGGEFMQKCHCGEANCAGFIGCKPTGERGERGQGRQEEEEGQGKEQEGGCSPPVLFSQRSSGLCCVLRTSAPPAVLLTHSQSQLFADMISLPPNCAWRACRVC